MAGQDPNKPKKSGKVELPSIDVGMNKVSPKSTGGGKGAKDEADKLMQDKPGEGKTASQIEDGKILARLHKRMERCINNESENRKAALEDLKFKLGEQWPADVAAQRNFDKRPCLTINKIPTFVHQVTNDIRQNRPSICVNPVGDKGDIEVAKMYRGLIRAIERQSHADVAYDTASDNAVSNGFGYFRLSTEYESPMSMNQVLVVKRIRNPFAVYLDPDHIEPDASDCRFQIISDMIPRSEFEDKYPDDDPIPYDQAGLGEDMKKMWVTKDAIRIVEYFEIDYKMKTLVMLDNGFTGLEDDLDPYVTEQIAAKKIKVIKQREAEFPEVMWYKATAKQILERTPWVGKWCPIVKVIGDEIDVEGKVTYVGIIRHAKDAQRMYNYWKALSLDTPLATPGGWTTMGAVGAGDELFDESGKVCRVVGTSPVHLHHKCFKITFDDGSEVVADHDHPWPVEERGKRKAATWDWKERIALTEELTPGKHFIKTVKPLDLPDADLPIHPYLLGVWLGDGHTAEPQITAGNQDMAGIRSNLAAAGCQMGSIRPSKGGGVFTVLGVRSRFTALGLLGNKHIPPQYLRASRRQRTALLQGLMDTDGSVSVNGQCSFTTTKAALSEGFAELLRSLGLKAVICHRAGRMSAFPGGKFSQGVDFDQFSFSCGDSDEVFALERKRAVQMRPRRTHPRRTKRHSIISVVAVPSVPVKCIKVDSPSSLYLAGPSMIPTHNTSETELIALAPKAPFIMEEGQMEGHESMWKQANVKSYPYLLYKGVNINGRPAPPPQRQPFAGVPAGVVQAAQGAAQDMMATTGIRFDSTMQERMMDESGKAIQSLTQRGELGAFHFVDNLSRSLRHLGDMMIDAIPKVYDTKRIATILREDDTEEQIEIDPNHAKGMGERRDGKTQKIIKIFNPNEGKYGCTVTIGPSYATKRIEAAESMMQFAKALPNTAQLIMDLIAKNMDWPGAQEMATRLAKAIPPQLMTPDQKDMTPQIQALLQNMDNQIKELTKAHQAALAALNDKTQDRAQRQDEIDKKFESSLLKIVADVETKTASTQEKVVANFNTHISHQMEVLGKHTTELIHALKPANSDKPKRKKKAAAE